MLRLTLASCTRVVASLVEWYGCWFPAVSRRKLKICSLNVIKLTILIVHFKDTNLSRIVPIFSRDRRPSVGRVDMHFRALANNRPCSLVSGELSRPSHPFDPRYSPSPNRTQSTRRRLITAGRRRARRKTNASAWNVSSGRQSSRRDE